MKLGIGMVGYGGIGKIHALAFRNLAFYYDPCPANVKLVGVCTATEKSGAKGVSQAGFEFATRNYKELLQRKDVDIIDCNVPNFLHPEVVIAALEAGKHVYCEKPLAPTFIVHDLEPSPSILAGYKVQQVLEAAYLSASTGREVAIHPTSIEGSCL